MSLKGESFQGQSGRDVILHTGGYERPWLDATAVRDSADRVSNDGIERLSRDRIVVSDLALSKQQIDAEISATLSATLAQLSEHLSAVSNQVFTMSPQEAELILAGVFETLIAISGKIRPDRTGSNSRNSPVRLVVEKFIETKLSSPDISPITIARDLEIPRSTLYKTFVDVGGVAKYIQNRRLAVAKSLLLRPEECRSLGQIASSLGFANCATFSKAFRKRFGRSPRSMRAFGIDHAALIRRNGEVHADSASRAA